MPEPDAYSPETAQSSQDAPKPRAILILAIILILLAVLCCACLLAAGMVFFLRQGNPPVFEDLRQVFSAGSDLLFG